MEKYVDENIKSKIYANPDPKIKGLYTVTSKQLPTNILTQALTEIDTKQWLFPFGANGRKVQHYGFLYDYRSGAINKKAVDFTPMVTQLADILESVCINSGIELSAKQKDIGYKFNQCIINNYTPGQGISEHIDNLAYGEIIGCYTLGSGANMRFKFNNNIKDIYVEANSLYIMSEDARYKWTHQMPAAKFDIVDGFKIPRSRRISATFRYVPM